jgi:hypothetical protein
MFKFASKISSQENADAIGEFLKEYELVCWSIEKDSITNKYLLQGLFQKKASIS